MQKKLPNLGLINIQNYYSVLIFNVLNGVWSDIYIMQIIIQQKLEELTGRLEINKISKT